MNLQKNIEELYTSLVDRKFIYMPEDLVENINWEKKNTKFPKLIASNNYNKINVIPEIEIDNIEKWIEESNSLQNLFEKLYLKEVHLIAIKLYCEMDVAVYSEIDQGTDNVPIQLIVNKFINDELQIYELKSVGVASIIFDVNKYTVWELKNYLKICDELNMFGLANCENKKEIEIALNIGFKFVSITNKMDKKNINISNSQILRRNIPNKIITLSSGNIRTSNQLKQLNSIGFDAAFVNYEIADKLHI